MVESPVALEVGLLVLARTLRGSLVVGRAQLTRRKVEGSVHWAVDDACLQAGI
jgi:hypothetical protein